MTDKTEAFMGDIEALKAHCMSLSMQCAVLTIFNKALIHTMHPEASKFVASEFRSGLEGLLSLGDDAPRVAAHHPAVLAQANALLVELERRSRAGMESGAAET
ncbi:hypothetical protein C7405_101672 [Paraburkholderia caballeronis]|uniref:hypothetical protein n=1 Tax=Paraburkholderia caballeronis TaxID=416943 RepID=UPI001065B9E3|nr:hypothetical protein [Paraburkholderia caballeronis]TDV39553.1 hypothetical protein C7405_101672 [Paraburkholderia caballeronis]